MDGLTAEYGEIGTCPGDWGRLPREGIVAWGREEGFVPGTDASCLLTSRRCAHIQHSWLIILKSSCTTSGTGWKCRLLVWALRLEICSDNTCLHRSSPCSCTDGDNYCWMQVQIPMDVSLAAGWRTSPTPPQSLTANENETQRKGRVYQIRHNTSLLAAYLWGIM